MKPSSPSLLLLTFLPLAAADFKIGYIDGMEELATISMGGHSDDIHAYVVQLDDEDICDSRAVDQDNFDGWGKWCGHQILECKGRNLVLGNGGDCGKAYGKHGTKSVPDGTYYADVYDVAAGNVNVGRCVYELSKTTDCTGMGSQMANTAVHCYTDACVKS